MTLERMNMNRIVLSGLVALVSVAVAGCPPAQPQAPVPPTPATVLTFTATPNPVDPGSAVTLEWDTEHSQHVSIRRKDGSPVPVDEPGRAHGSVEVTVDADEVFLLTARGEGGADSAAAAVAVIEKSERQPLFVAVPEKVAAGEPVTLVWSVPGEGTITVRDGAGAVVYEGNNRAASRVIRPTSNQTYTLTADGKDVTVQVSAWPMISGFSAAPAAVAHGDTVSLQWSVLGAAELTVSAEGRGVLHTESDPAAMADGSFTEEVDFTFPEGGLVRYELTAQGGGHTVTSTLQVSVGVDPVFTELVVPEFARENGEYSVSWRTGRANRVEVLLGGQVIHVAQSQTDVNQGQLSLSSPQTEHALTFRATNARGGTVVENRSVSAVGAPTYNAFAATPSPLPQGGDAVQLSWDVSNARRVRLSVQDGPLLYEAMGPDAEQGSIPVYPNKQTIYVLNADNMVGDAIAAQTVTVDVTSPARLVFSPSTVPLGTPVQITGTNPPVTGPVRSDYVLKNVPGDEWVELLGNGGTPLPVLDSHDDDSYLITLPEEFTTRVMGTEITSRTVNVSLNGWLDFRPSTYTAIGSSLPSSSLPHLAIVPFGRDLRSSATTQILWRLDGTGPSQRLIVQWEDIRTYSSATMRQTFQAQIYRSGKIVFAYKSVTGWGATDNMVFGLQNHDSTRALTAAPAELWNGKPVSGDSFTFNGELTFPITVAASATPITFEVEVAPGAWLTIEDAPGIIPPDQFGISEVNHNPVAGQEQWFEVQNNTAQAIDLDGWTITFAPGVTHTIAGPLLIPANGYIVLGQSASSAEGATVDYAYGTSFTLPAAAGTVSLGISGGVYSSASWASAGTAGTSLQVAVPDSTLMLAAGVTTLTCPSRGTYGASGQRGSPGAANESCFPYTLQPAPANGFTPIGATGTRLTSISAHDTYQSVTLGRPVNLFGQPRSQLWVSAEGFVSFVSISESHYSNPTTVTTSNPNGVLAAFWDDLNPGSGNVYWQQFDPDATPASGDEYTVISWENWRVLSGGALNFQIVIREGTGDIEYHYGAMSSTDTGGARSLGSSATTWLENEAGTAAISYNVNSTSAPGIQPNTGLIFVYTP